MRSISRARSPARVIAADPRRGDDATVTRRAWLILVVGALLIGTFGGFAFANRSDSATFTPTASWNMFPPAQWQALRHRAAGRGFAPATLHVVAATSKQNGTPLALLAGRTSGRTCFVLVQGHALGRTICKLARPMVIFAFRDRFGNRPAIDVLGLARRNVVSVASTSIVNGKPWASGVVLTPVSGGFAFAGGMSGGTSTFVGRTAAGRLLTRVHVAP